MKTIVMFGIGENGKKMVDTYTEYGADLDFEITAIADNRTDLKSYRGIPVIRPAQIMDCKFDEIWIASIYYQEIRKQLQQEIQIKNIPIRYVEYPMPFIEGQIYKKYREEITGNKRCDSDEMQTIIDYIKKNGVRMYNYSFYDEYMEKEVPVFFDSEHTLFYGMYLGYRMYFSQKLNTLEKAKNYFRYVCMEQDKRSPHCYLMKSCKCGEYKNVVDIGAAEGVFALQVLETAGHVYLIEADEDWCKALELTFQKYREKITIIKGYVSDKQEKEQIALDKLFSDKQVDFIKMDIEGAEMQALHGAEKLIEQCSPQMAICTYHNPDDNEKIREWLLERGYAVENSAGYVICQNEEELNNRERVDFRRALLRAERNRK